MIKKGQEGEVFIKRILKEYIELLSIRDMGKELTQ